MRENMPKIILTVIVSVFFINACGGANPANINSNTANVGGNQAASGTANAVSSNANSANISNVAANAIKPADNSPKRIGFSKGANWGAANITLAPGAAQKFVVGAKSGQTMDVEVSSKETSVNLIKGKAQTTEDFGYLNAELQSNGDYVFEVKNPTKKEIKTSVKVTIENGEGQGGDDGDKSESADANGN